MGLEKIIGNNNWQNINILQKENIGPHLKGLSIITNFNQQIVDPELYDGDQQYSFYNGFNVARLLTTVDLEYQSRESLNMALQNLDFHSKIIRGYRKISKNNNRFIIIDAEKSFEEIHYQLQKRIITSAVLLSLLIILKKVSFLLTV